jgi:hypothetical protein
MDEQVKSLKDSLEHQTQLNVYLVAQIHELTASRARDEHQFRTALENERSTNLAALDREAQLFQDLLESAEERYTMLLQEKQLIEAKYTELLQATDSAVQVECGIRANDADDQIPFEDQLLRFGDYLQCLDSRKVTPSPL